MYSLHGKLYGLATILLLNGRESREGSRGGAQPGWGPGECASSPSGGESTGRVQAAKGGKPCPSTIRWTVMGLPAWIMWSLE